MNKQAILNSLFISLFFLCAASSFSQIGDTIRYDKDSNIISAPEKKYVAVYTRGARRNYQLKRGQIKQPVYSYDTLAVRNAETKISYYKKYFSEDLSLAKECIYVPPSSIFQYSDLIRIRALHEREIIPPASFLFYSDTLSADRYESYYDSFLMHLKLKRSVSDYFQPFYFKRAEVSNKEYREFVNWVIDSTIRVMLVKNGDSSFISAYNSKALLNKNEYILNYEKKIDLKDTTIAKILEPLYLPVEERFYKRKELDARRFNYWFTDAKGNACLINVYPDTLAWVHDFNYSIVEPLTNMYFWHPAYNDYPVTGVSHQQAEAFLYWKTTRKQNELNRTGSRYIVKYELPDEMEWEMLATRNKKNSYSKEYTSFYDDNYLTDLILKDDTCGFLKFSTEKTGRAGRETNSEFTLIFPADPDQRSIWTSDFLDAPTNICIYNSHLRAWKKPYHPGVVAASRDQNEVLFMGNNVSEWMKDSYQENWLPVYSLHQSLLEKMNTRYFKQILEMERFYNTANDTNGYLIRGGNWYDLSLAVVGDKNFEGMNKKIFKDPRKSFSTVGFRYVIKIYRKDELQLLNEISGNNPAKK
jgi:formylglycine-generating enzyme required for sulfatase activity